MDKTKEIHTDSRIISNMFFRLLPVQIILVAIGSLNNIIDGAMASNLIGADALTAMWGRIIRISAMCVLGI